MSTHNQREYGLFSQNNYDDLAKNLNCHIVISTSERNLNSTKPLKRKISRWRSRRHAFWPYCKAITNYSLVLFTRK